MGAAGLAGRLGRDVGPGGARGGRPRHWSCGGGGARQPGPRAPARRGQVRACLPAGLPVVVIYLYTCLRVCAPATNLPLRVMTNHHHRRARLDATQQQLVERGRVLLGAQDIGIVGAEAGRAVDEAAGAAVVMAEYGPHGASYGGTCVRACFHALPVLGQTTSTNGRTNGNRQATRASRSCTGRPWPPPPTSSSTAPSPPSSSPRESARQPACPPKGGLVLSFSLFLLSLPRTLRSFAAQALP